LWFPEITLPVEFGQVRTATRLPVLVMVSGYFALVERPAGPVTNG
jgi:hypothetical protein